MAVKARFWVQSFSKQAVSGGGVSAHVELKPVIRSTGQPGDGQNIDWSKYTPSGLIQLTVSQEGAQQWFEERLGKDVAITFDDVAD